MTLSPDINSYWDVAEVLREALATGGGRMEFNSKAAAITWRLRAHTYRKLERERLNVSSPPGISVPTAYDRMRLVWHRDRPLVVEILFDKPTGKFIPNENGAPAQQPESLTPGDPLLALALDILKDEK